HVPELDIRILGSEAGCDLPPQPRRLHHVRLVDRRELPPSAPCELEAAPDDPLDLRRRVLARVVSRAVGAPAARAEVEAADELAAPPNTCSSSSNSSGSASTTRTAAAVTSGPIPSPGRQTIFRAIYRSSSRLVRASRYACSSRSPFPLSAPLLACSSSSSSRA